MAASTASACFFAARLFQAIDSSIDAFWGKGVAPLLLDLIP